MGGSGNQDSSYQSLMPAVLIHGLIGTLDDPDVLRRFGPRPVLAPDLVGYGRQVVAAVKRITIDAQVEHLQELFDRSRIERAHLVGHSVGGVVAALFADRNPHRVASLVSIEGNFSLADAFWSADVARMTDERFEQIFAGSRADPAAWLHAAGVCADQHRLALARHWLGYQPASSVQAMARSVVKTTADTAYEQMLRAVFAKLPVHLVAGERSRDSWDTPGWALRASRSLTVMPDSGHLMMAEHPQAFGDTIAQILVGADTGEGTA